jgi:hypothetical protein
MISKTYSNNLYILVYKGKSRSSKKNGGKSLKSDCVGTPG